MGMSRWSVWLLLLALAWPAGGGLTLICDSPQAPAMPCCEEGIEACEIPVGMLPDCCRVEAESRQLAGLSITASLLQPDGWDQLSLAPVLGLTVFLGASLEHISAPPTWAAALPPPYAVPFFSRTTVLRI
jgi:hypothetical protein